MDEIIKTVLGAAAVQVGVFLVAWGALNERVKSLRVYSLANEERIDALRVDHSALELRFTACHAANCPDRQHV